MLELSDLYERAFGCVPVEEINAAWFFESLTLHRRLQASPARRTFDIGVAALAAVADAADHADRRARHQARLAGPGLLPPGARGRGRPPLHDHQVPLDAHRRRGRRRSRSGPPSATRASRASARFIRRYRIDELPQLWNVVRGEMALVGPRPERPELVAEIARQLPFYEPRHLVRPGITGWAQVYAPYAASIEETLEKLSYDLYYVKHQSFATDAGIMLSTLGVMAGGRGAR